MDLPSLEGIYSKWPRPLIIISSLRPPGRQHYTCGHELGHHIYSHEFRVDMLSADDKAKTIEDDEFLVNCFAGFLLMPKAAVVRAFVRRGWNPASSTPVQLYTVACWLGVGYQTLVTHMRASLKLLSYPQAALLGKTSPKEIKTQVLGRSFPENLVLVDPWWLERAVDLHVGDFVLAMPGTANERSSICPIRSDHQGTLLQAVAPGVDRIFHPNSGWSSFVRVSRRGYIGRSIFRHQEEVEDEYSSSVFE